MRSALAAFLSPDGDEARRWADEELRRAKYAEPTATPVERLGAWILERLDQLSITIDANASLTGSVTIIILVTAISLVAIIYGRLRSGGKAKRSGRSIILDDDRDIGALVRDAGRAHGAGDYSAACVDYYRACIRILDSRGLIIAAPGTTALEAARQGASTGLPLEPGARIFDAVMYGGARASAADAEMLADLVEQSRRAVRVAV